MSAPNTNLDKDAQRHRGPLRGMLGVVLFALVLLAGLALWAFSRGGTPNDASTVDGRTGATEQAAEPVEDDAAPLVQPDATTGADASVGEEPDTNPTETQSSTTPEGDAAPTPSADD